MPNSNNTKSQSNKGLMIVVGALVFLAIIVFSVNKLIEVKGRAIAQEVIAESKHNNQQAKVVAIDRDDLFKKLSSETDDQIRVLKAINMLTQMMQNDGYLVINQEAVMMAPERFIVKSFSLAEIEAMAKERDINVDDDTQKMIEDAQRQASEALKELERKSQQLMQQFKQQ
jgi:hypothetical protein